MRWLRWVAAIADLDRLASWCGDWRVGGRAGAFYVRFWPVRGAVLGASAWRGPWTSARPPCSDGYILLARLHAVLCSINLLQRACASLRTRAGRL